MSSHIADRTEKKQYNILCLRIDSFSWAAHLDTSLSRAFTVLFIRGPLNSSPSTVVAKKKNNRGWQGLRRRFLFCLCAAHNLRDKHAKMPQK